MINISIIKENTNEIFFEVDLLRKNATFTFSMEKYSNIENDDLLKRLGRMLRSKAISGGIRSFESYINRINKKTKIILTKRSTGEISPNEEGNYTV